MDAISSQLRDVENIMRTLLPIRYSAGCALGLVVWDSVITLDHEVALIWAPPFCPSKWPIILTRYATTASLIYANYIFSGISTHISELQCKIFPVFFGAVALICSSLYSAYVIMRLCVLWDQRFRVKVILYAMLFTVYVPTLVLGAIGLVTFYKETISISFLDTSTCFVTKESILSKISFGCIPAFDILVMIFAAANALDRPRRPQQKLAVEMRRDGVYWFLIIFALRLTNFFVYLFLPIRHVFAALFWTWALISITVSRMHFDVTHTTDIATNKGTQGLKVNLWAPSQENFQLVSLGYTPNNVGVGVGTQGC